MLVPSVSATNLLINGSFDTGDFTGWDAYGWFISASGGYNIPSYDGNYFATTGCVGSGCIDDPDTQLSQSVATIIGVSYWLSFQYQDGNNPPPNELEVIWDGNFIADFGPNGTLGAIDPYANFAFELPAATTTLTTINFLGRQDNDHNALDAIDLEAELPAPTETPEPATLLTAAATLSLLPLLRARKTRAPVP